jgi:hypothetical protein
MALRAGWYLAAWMVLGTAALADRAAAETEVDLELVLAVDVSRSMDADELRLQRQGYANAFRDQEVLRAVSGGLHGRIAVTYVEWAGPQVQSQVTPWTVIGTEAEAEAYAALLESGSLAAWRGTSISGGLIFAASLFEGNGITAPRRVIDISGDGPNNLGPRVDETRDFLVNMGIVINGLPLNLKAPGGGFYNIDRLDIYYEDCVIGGPGAFLITVEDPQRLAEAIRRKMVLEISGITPQPSMPGIVPVQYRPPRIDCLIGEYLRSRIWDN